MTKKLLVVGFLILLYLGSMWYWISGPDGRKIELTAPCSVGISSAQVVVKVRFKELLIDLPEKYHGKFSPGDSAWIGLTGTCHFEPKGQTSYSRGPVSVLVGGSPMPMASMPSDGYIEVEEVRFYDQGTDHTESLKIFR